MSAKPVTKKPPNYHYSFRLPDGRYIGHATFHGPLEPVSLMRATWFSKEGIAARKKEILRAFPSAKIVPTPILNPESGEWETPIHAPSLN